MKKYLLVCCLLSVLIACKKETVTSNSTSSQENKVSNPKIKTITTESYEYLKLDSSNDTVCTPTGETSTTNFEYDAKGRIIEINTVIKFENKLTYYTINLNYTSNSNVLLEGFFNNELMYNTQVTLDEKGYAKYLKTQLIIENQTLFDTIHYDLDGIILPGSKGSNSNTISNGNLVEFTLGDNFDKIKCGFDLTKSSTINDLNIYPFLNINFTNFPFSFDFSEHSLYDQAGSLLRTYRDSKNFLFITGLFGKQNRNLLVNVENNEINNVCVNEFDSKQRISKRTITTFTKYFNYKRNKEIITYSYTD